VKTGDLQALLLVGSGGFVGSVLRYAVAGWVQRLDPLGSFPYGTLAVNAFGCLAIGVLGGLADARSVLGPEARLLVLVGVLGGFTTFSTFGHETLALLRAGSIAAAGANVLASVALCLVATWLGYGFGSTR
jgi:CrcB protein